MKSLFIAFALLCVFVATYNVAILLPSKGLVWFFIMIIAEIFLTSVLKTED